MFHSMELGKSSINLVDVPAFVACLFSVLILHNRRNDSESTREKFKPTMGLLEKIKEIEAEMARTQKNKATEYHLGLLKAKLAKFRRDPSKAAQICRQGLF